MKAVSTLRGASNIEVNWKALRKVAPAFAILGVILFFVVLQIPASKQHATTSLTPFVEAAANPASASGVASGTHITAAPSSALANPTLSAPASTDSSHLRVTDRPTEATIAELSRYEIRNLPRAANYGDDEAALQLGMLYELGQGFPQNCTKAAEWIMQAAQEGNSAAEYNLALRYRDGDGVPANPQEADHWFRKAALHKSPSPERVLAGLPTNSPNPSTSKD